MPVNARELLILNKALGVDPLVDAILSEEGSAEKELFRAAKELKRSPLKSMYVEACLLASNDLEKISSILELDVEVLAMYSSIFYSVEGLDKLSKLELLDVKDRNEQLLKIWALNQGLDFIAWRLGMQTTISPVDGLTELFSTAMYKAKEACFSGNASEESKEAVKWSKMAMDLARLLKAYTMDTNQAKQDLQLALEEVVPGFKGFDTINDDAYISEEIPYIDSLTK